MSMPTLPRHPSGLGCQSNRTGGSLLMQPPLGSSSMAAGFALKCQLCCARAVTATPKTASFGATRRFLPPHPAV